MNLLAPLLTLETVRLNLDVVSRKRLYEEAGLVFEVTDVSRHRIERVRITRSPVPAEA